MLKALNGTLKEMAASTLDLKIDVPFSPGVDIDLLTQGDTDPLFVVVEALNPQTSKNGRIWTVESLHNMSEQINQLKPDAYMGHLKDEDRSTVAPTSMTIWLGSKVIEIEGKPRLFIKGYVMPYATDLKAYLRAAKATGKKVAVSVYGQVEQKYNRLKKAYDIIKFKLESIDWARPGSEGVPGFGYLKLAKEMEGDILEKEEILKSATLSEMVAFNPELVDEAKAEIMQEMETQKSLVKTLEDEKTALVSSSEETKATLAEMQKETNGLLASYIDSELESKVASASVRSIAKSQVMSEMADNMSKTLVDETITKVIESPEIKSILAEMDKANVINPGIDNRTKTSSKFTKVS